jgi:hypothetical protein
MLKPEEVGHFSTKKTRLTDSVSRVLFDLDYAECGLNAFFD